MSNHWHKHAALCERGVGDPPTYNAPVGDSPTYYLADQLTGEAALKLASRLSHLPLERFQTVVLSFGNVTSLDATGLAVIVRLYSQLVTNGRRLVLRDVRPDVADKLEDVGLGSLFGEHLPKHGFLRPITGRFRALLRASA